MNLPTPEQNLAFFETFGYLRFPGLMADSIGWITSEFEAVFTDRQVQHDGAERSCIIPFADQRERLCGLLDDPRIHDIAALLLGDDFNYIGSDGNYYTGDTGWHSDGYHLVGRYIKFAFYLDPVAGGSGALRVIPGSHRIEGPERWEACSAARSQELWGIAASQVPAIALESTPGDVVVFNHNLMHSSVGGSSRRRMFTLNLCRHCESDREKKELREYINAHARFWLDHVHGEVMRSTATAQRKRHLEQVAALDGDLPGLSAQLRSKMEMPAYGRTPEQLACLKQQS